MVNNIPAYLQGLETEQPKEDSNIPAYLQGVNTSTVPENQLQLILMNLLILKKLNMVRHKKLIYLVIYTD